MRPRDHVYSKKISTDRTLVVHVKQSVDVCVCVLRSFTLGSKPTFFTNLSRRRLSFSSGLIDSRQLPLPFLFILVNCHLILLLTTLIASNVLMCRQEIAHSLTLDIAATSEHIGFCVLD